VLPFVGGSQTVVHNVKVGSEQHFEGLRVQAFNVKLFEAEVFFLNQALEKFINFLEVVFFKKVQILGGHFKNFGDFLMVKEDVKAIH